MARVSRRGKREERVSYVAAVYIRESGESSENLKAAERQQEQLERYSREKGFLPGPVYLDLGRSGRRYQRPAFLRLLEEGEKGKFQILVIRDLSRLGRNYKEMGFFLEYYFEVLGIRLISLRESYDSSRTLDRQKLWHLAFQNLLNERYALDIAKKASAVYQIRQNSHVYFGGRPPYGYQRKEDGTLQADPFSSNIVKQIFDRMEWSDPKEVTGWLNQKKLLCPMAYYISAKMKAAPKTEQTEWKIQSVRSLLSNPVYLGILIRRDGTVILDAHPPLLEEREFWKIQEKLSAWQDM